jgi:hypothetical protein
MMMGIATPTAQWKIGVYANGHLLPISKMLEGVITSKNSNVTQLIWKPSMLTLRKRVVQVTIIRNTQMHSIVSLVGVELSYLLYHHPLPIFQLPDLAVDFLFVQALQALSFLLGISLGKEISPTRFVNSNTSFWHKNNSCILTNYTPWNHFSMHTV